MFSTLGRMYFPGSVYLKQEISYKKPVLVKEPIRAELRVIEWNQKYKDVTFISTIFKDLDKQPEDWTICSTGFNVLRIPYLEVQAKS
mmetsp:Transcript_32652/g.24115  ORF Transcript_32652/g.24115 Transcript_32652/m.24115 type:complete len:87 (-) Transcript_32652:7-267(-)